MCLGEFWFKMNEKWESAKFGKCSMALCWTGGLQNLFFHSSHTNRWMWSLLYLCFRVRNRVNLGNALQKIIEKVGWEGKGYDWSKTCENKVKCLENYWMLCRDLNKNEWCPLLFVMYLYSQVKKLVHIKFLNMCTYQYFIFFQAIYKDKSDVIEQKTWKIDFNNWTGKINI